MTKALSKKRPASRRRQGMIWTSAENAKLTAVWGHLGSREMRAVFGRTETAIYNQACVLSLPAQSQGKKSLNAAAKILGVSYETARKIITECGITVEKIAPVQQYKRTFGNSSVDMEASEAAVRQFYSRTVTTYAHGDHSDRAEMALRYALDRRGMRLVVGRGRGARYPIQFLDEVRAGIDGPWSAVWRAVLAEGELPVARWFVALAVYDTIHADAAGREWIEVVARIKTAKIINTIVEKIRAAMGPGVARAEDRTRKVRVA